MPKLNFDTKETQKSSVEIILQVRDKNGNPTGKTKAYTGSNCRDMSDWYNKQNSNKKKRKRKKKKEDKK